MRPRFTKKPASLTFLSSAAFMRGNPNESSLWQQMLEKRIRSDEGRILSMCFPSRNEFLFLHGGVSSSFLDMSYEDNNSLKELDPCIPFTRLNCTEEENTLDALRLAEFENIWFFLLFKVLDNHNYIDRYGIHWQLNTPRILVSKHWWQVLVDSGFLVRLMNCQTPDDIQNLLMQAGDIESNPGPVSYKETCKRQFQKKRVAKYEGEMKMKRAMQKMKQEEEKEIHREHFSKNKKFVEMQIFGFSETNCLMNETLKHANDSIATLTSAITSTLDEFKNSFKEAKSYMYKALNIFDLINDIVMALLQLTFAKPGYKLASLSVEIYRLITKYGMKCTLDDLRNLILPLTTNTPTTTTETGVEAKEVEMQGEGETKNGIFGDFGVGDLTSMLTPTTIVSLLFVLLSGTFLSILPKKTQIESVVKRCGDLGKSLKGVRDLNNEMHEYTTVMLDYFKVHMLGMKPESELEKFVSGIDAWFDEVVQLLSRTGDVRKTDLILKDPNVVIEVENLYKRGLEFSREIADKKLGQKLSLPFLHHMKLMTDLMKQVDTSGAFGSRPRTQPVVIWLFGESGVGKSGMSWPLAVDLNNMFVPNKQEAKEFSKNIYMRNVEQEFWDNYQGQNVVIYDDFGQLKDSQSQPNMEFMELIRTANIAPYPLHMAHLEDKRKTRFTSKVILLTSNVFEHNVSSLTFPDAFRRRIDLCARVYNKDEYTKMGFSKATGKPVKRLDGKKVQEIADEVISTDVYLVDIHDPESGDVLEKGLDYEDFLERAEELAKKNFDSSHKMNKFLEKYAESRFGLEKKKIEMQGDDKVFFQGKLGQVLLDPRKFKNIDSFKYEYDHLTTEQAQSLFANPISFSEDLYDENGHKLDRIDCVFQIIDELRGDNPMECIPANIEQEIVKCFQETFCIRTSKFVKDLQHKKQCFMSTVRSWKDKVVTEAREHPFNLVRKLILVISSIFLLSRFWNMIFKGERKIKRIIVYELEATQNVTVLPFDESHKKKIGYKDLSSFNYKTLLTHIDDFVKPEVEYIHVHKAWNSVIKSVDIIAKMQNRHIYVLTNVKNADIAGKNYEFEANTSGDQVTLAKKPKQVEATPSADPTTLRNKKLNVEATASADPTTQKSRVLRIEATPSGDPTTMLKHRPVVEATSSGSDLTIVKAGPKKVEAHDTVEAEMQMWKDQVAQNLISSRIFSNLYKICKIDKEGNSVPLLNGLFVRANIMLVPGHIRGFLNKEDILELRSVFGITFTIPYKEVKVIQIVNALGDDKEAILLSFPKYVSAHHDLVKHFSDGESMAKYKRADICLPCIRYSTKIQNFLMHILGNTECKAAESVYELCDKNKGEFILREGLEYKLNTIAGDCGAPVIVNETQVLRKIAGIHVAGSKSGDAYAESITQKDLLRAFKQIGTEMQISLDLDNMLKFKKIPKVPIGEDFEPDVLREICDIPCKNLIPVGKIPQPLFEPCKTDIRPSLIHGTIAEIKTKPAILRNVGDVNIKHKNIQKNAVNVPYIEKDLIERAYVMTKKIWLAGARPELQRVLTYEEAVLGNDSSEYITSINRGSSPGYPWICNKTRGTKGKQGWFGDGMEFELSEEVRRAVDFRIDQARQGKRVPVLWLDTLKDERRPIEKVDALKTRVFNNGPMDFSIVFRQYYLGFIAHLMENRITNEVSIGTNVESQDWKKTARKLSTKGKKVIAGDFSTFDGSLNTCIMEKFADLANEFYDDGPENALIRHVLLADVYNSVHICGDSVYLTTHSQPSGNPATTPLNCFVNSMGFRLVFDECIKNAWKVNLLNEFHPLRSISMKDFDTFVSMVSYGDDDVVNFSDSIADWFNMDTITTAFAKFGFTYTDETKTTSGTVPKWRTLEEVAYLKRKFRYDMERRVWEAPLAMDTILEMPNWCRGGLDILEGTRVNAQNAIRELSMHPKPVFLEWSKRIENSFFKKTGEYLDVDTYEGYAQDRLMKYYL